MSKKIDTPLFSAHEHALEHDSCPECGPTHGGELLLRHGKSGAFLGCSRYPECGYIKALHQNDGHVVKQLGVPCPKCADELVLRQGRYGMFIGCNAYPQCDHIESLNSPQETISEEQIKCPECRTGSIKERQSRFGKRFWACDNYPKCKFTVNQKPINGSCEVCHFALLTIKKSAKGDKMQCASRKCLHIQNDNAE